MTLYGAEADDQLGTTMESGDINGDSIPDLLIGAPGNDKTYVVFGSPTLSGQVDLFNMSNITFYQRENGDNFGAYQTAADLNGDGIDDLILSADLADGPFNNQSQTGETYVVFGRTVWPAVINFSTYIPNVTIYGIDEGDQSGFSLGTLDFNDDGIQDLAILARTADGKDNLVSSAGEVSVVYGRALFEANISLADANFTYYGKEVNAMSGGYVGSGDINGDGNDDLLISSSGVDPFERLSAGQVAIIYGPPTDNELDNNATLPSVIIYGRDAGDNLGRGITAGDFNNDTYSDIMVGASLSQGFNNVFTNAGEAYIIDGFFISSTHQVIGNASNVTTTGVTSLHVNISQISAQSGALYNDSRLVEFYDENEPLMRFTHNFTSSNLDLTRISITKSGAAIIVNVSDTLASGTTKTIYLSDSSFTGVCVRDADINSADDISTACNSANETFFTTIQCQSNSTVNGITCTYAGTQFALSNLSFSGAEGSTAPVPEFHEWALMIVLTVALAGVVIMRRD